MVAAAAAVVVVVVVVEAQGKEERVVVGKEQVVAKKVLRAVAVVAVKMGAEDLQAVPAGRKAKMANLLVEEEVAPAGVEKVVMVVTTEMAKVEEVVEEATMEMAKVAVVKVGQDLRQEKEVEDLTLMETEKDRPSRGKGHREVMVVIREEEEQERKEKGGKAVEREAKEVRNRMGMMAVMGRAVMEEEEVKVARELVEKEVRNLMGVMVEMEKEGMEEEEKVGRGVKEKEERVREAM